MEFSKRVQYERLSNGADVYLLQTPAKDVVTCRMAFAGGVHATYNKQSVARILDDMLPGSIKKMKRATVLEKFEMLGAEMSVLTTNGNLMVTLTARSGVFLEAFQLTVDVLTTPTFPQIEFEEACARLENSCKHALENTRIQANIALMQALYQKGHPHWLPSTLASIKEIPRLTRHDIKDFYTRTFSAVGAVICVVGDIRTEKYMESIRKSLQALPSKASLALPSLPVDLLQNASEVDCVCTLKNKMSIDTLIGIPLTLTREHHAFQALQVAISILGGSTSSRFFTKLRTEKSLTYGANAIMNGFGEGYPGYLFGLAIFPATVFLEGRNALKEIVKEFAEKGVTKIELEERKEEIAGRFKVGLSTTSGVCSLLVTTLLEGKSISYIDTYVDTISNLTLANVNEVVKEQVDFTLAKTASAGAVDQKGQPL